MTPTPKRLTPEREKEIREYLDDMGRTKPLTNVTLVARDLLAELDALRAELKQYELDALESSDQHEEEFYKIKNLEKDRDQLRAQYKIAVEQCKKQTELFWEAEKERDSAKCKVALVTGDRDFLLKERDQMREALEFYADETHYYDQTISAECACCVETEEAVIRTDEGKRARTALGIVK